MPPSSLIVRADASHVIGIGHIMRCIAIGQRWKELVGSVRFACVQIPLSLRQRLTQEGFELDLFCSSLDEDRDEPSLDASCAPGSAADSKRLVGLLEQHQAAAVVMDGYRFDGSYQVAVREYPARSMLLDDYGHADYYAADLILNQNLGAEANLYRNRRPTSELLLGPDYALLRKEFLSEGQKARKNHAMPLHLLVSLGGSDCSDVIIKVVEALKRLDQNVLHTRILLNGAVSRLGAMQSAVGERMRIEFLHNVTDMAEQYRWADIALAAGGSSNWEMSYFGLPRAMIVLADNQVDVASRLSQTRAALLLGNASDVTDIDIADGLTRLLEDPALRNDLADRSQRLVDGLGALRCVDALTALVSLRQAPLKCASVSFREATFEDWKVLLDWRNDPLTQMASRTGTPLLDSSHQEWLRNSLADERRELLIAMSNEQPIGTIRIDFAEVSELSWTVAPEYRGLGFGRLMVSRAIERLSRREKPITLQAVVRVDNPASQRIAKSCGFQLFSQDNTWMTYRMHLHAEMTPMGRKERAK